MSEVQHSPIPWHVHEGGNFVKIGMDGYDQYVSENGYLAGPFCIAEVEHCQSVGHASTHDQAMANARFIVHAANCHEDLLEALKEMIEAYNVPRGCCVKAIAAIAKATGETP